ncbi:MAG: hypothetical protein RR860_03440 [Janthinobacterium sp.]
MPGEKPQHFWRAQQQAPAPQGKSSALQHRPVETTEKRIGRNPYVRDWAHFLFAGGKRIAQRNIKIIINTETCQHYKKHCCFHDERLDMRVDKLSRQMVLSIAATQSAPKHPQ